MEFLQKAAEWLMGPSGVLLFAALWGISEFLAVFPKVQSNSVFQAIKNGLAWIRAKLAAKQA